MNLHRSTMLRLFPLIVMCLLASTAICRAQNQPPGFDNYVDLGNPDDEKFHELRGWGRINRHLLPKGFGDDNTSRYQSLHGANSFKLYVEQPGVPHNLTIRAEAGLCDDSFEVYLNNTGPVYSYKHLDASPGKSFHQFAIDPALTSETSIEITFRNISRDSCGLAAIYFVAIEQSNGQATRIGEPQQPAQAPAILSIRQALPIAEDYLRKEKTVLTNHTLVEAKLDSCDGRERCWKLRWERTDGAPEDVIELNVSMQGRVTLQTRRE